MGTVDAQTIDEINILEATKRAFAGAFEALAAPVEVLLVDALKGLVIPAEQLPIVKGDAKSYLIAAASIVAKVTRDRMMQEFDALYPVYRLLRATRATATAEHIRAIVEHGPCPIHRRSFIRNGSEQRARKRNGRRNRRCASTF